MLLAQFSDVVHGIYDATLTPEHWPAALDGIAALAGARGAVVWAKTARGWTTPLYSPSLKEAMNAYVQEGWGQHNPWLQGRLDAGFRVGDVYRDLDLVSIEEMRSNPFYTDFLRRFDLGRQMVAVIYSQLGNPTCLAVHGAMSRAPFQAEEMQTHLMIGRHFEQSLRTTCEFSKLQAEHATMTAAFEAVDRPMFILDEQRHPVQINRSGQDLMDSYFVRDQGCLKPVAPEDEAAFSGVVEGAHRFAGNGEAEPRPITISHKDRTARMMLWGVPLVGASADKLGLGPAQKQVLVVAQPLLQEKSVDPTVIRGAYGLTTGEARLAALLAGGRSVKQAAAELGLTEGTTRFVLTRIFQKMGIHRQAELVSRILQLAR
ncbi:helix-turn-helix transcriptional regulator [Xanthobacter sp. ZOL 2024]